MNVEEKVATLEALLARVKKNAALPRAPRTDEMAATGWGPVATAPQPAGDTPKPPVTSLPALPTSKTSAQPVKVEPVKVEPVKAPTKIEPSDPWLDELADIVAGVDERPAPALKPADVAPAASKVARPTTPELSAKQAASGPEKVAPTATGSALPKVTAEKIAPTATGSALPKVTAEKIAPTATGSALPKVTATATPAAEKIAPAATGSALPKVTPATAEAKPAKSTASAGGTSAADREARLFAQLALMPDELTGDEATKIVLPALKSELVAATKTDAPPKAEAFPKVEAAPKPEPTPPSPPVELPRIAVVEDDLSGDEETQLMEGTRPSAATLQAALRAEEKKAAEVEPEMAVISAPVAGEVSPAEARHVASQQPDEGDDHDPDLAEPGHDLASGDAPLPEPEEQPETEPAEGEPEATAPSRRYVPPPEPEITVTPRPPRSRVGLALAAVLLAAAGTYLGFRNGWFGGERVVPPTPTALPTTPSVGTVLAPPVRPVALPTVTASATVAPPAATTAPSAAVAPTTSATTAPSAPVAPATSARTASTAVPSVDGDGTNLAPNRGYLVIDSPKEEGVYNGGVFIGLTGHKIELDCGIKFVRLGVPPADGVGRPNSVVWTSEGKSAIVACKAITRVAIMPTR